MAGEVYHDRVLERSTTIGAGAYTLSGAATGFQGFAVVGPNPCFYAAYEIDAGGAPSGGWEVGRGSYSAGSLTRDRILASSNGGAAVVWVTGTRLVALVNPAEHVRDVPLSGTGAPGIDAGFPGSIYFDITDPNDPVFWFKT